MTAKILIVEDDFDIQTLIKISLSNKQLGKIYLANDKLEAEQLLKNNHFDVVLLDLNLKSENGYELVKYFKNKDTKLIVVTAKDTDLDVYKGFENGAVDYVKKPFDPIELAYRVGVHIQSSHTHNNKNLKVNLDTTDVVIDNEKVNLTSREYDLLMYFIKNTNKVVTKSQIYEHVWGYSISVDDNTLMVHIRTLRKKIEDDANNPQLIQTVRGKGYIYRG
ncbi:response regulator transcription factor [Mammaliicoccus vitulinus]|uniref:response regulator transcription factor n=1 Tax=Mammaliicoccus vitulinus TaxID=71237 RepID=UPI00194E7203|nr:response regulator transcription factor [Mammaliicoccus vitulinus]MBM6629517.1 response regulator transcription factor [Mammaliicoccus vitulinus]MBO3077835.1 response regulator transcription factor [Mammaliicoccus vitulinus]WQK88190.1 response regulator transcription factor [Mammaliicoccus vitulinus]